MVAKTQRTKIGLQCQADGAQQAGWPDISGFFLCCKDTAKSTPTPRCSERHRFLLILAVWGTGLGCSGTKMIHTFFKLTVLRSAILKVFRIRA